MNGSQIKYTILCIKLLILNLVFGSLPIILYDFNILEMFFYYGVLCIMSFWCLIYCYKMVYITYQDNKYSKRTIDKLHKNGFFRLGDSPVFSTYKSDGYGSLAKELYYSCKEFQRKLFEEKGYVIIVGSKEELKSFSKQRFINGYFSRIEKYILLYTDCETTDKKPYDIKIVSRTSFTSTFWHEWGHFLDFSNNYISETFCFSKFYKDVKNKFNFSVRFLCAGIPSLYFRRYPKISLYELVSSSEYFACKYSEYKRGVLLSDYLVKTFDKVEGVENVNYD